MGALKFVGYIMACIIGWIFVINVISGDWLLQLLPTPIGGVILMIIMIAATLLAITTIICIVYNLLGYRS